MPKDGPISAISLQPRAQGEAMIAITADHDRMRISGLRQQGAAKVLTPRTHGDALEAVFLNTAGGVTGGDRFAYRGEAGAGAHLTLTTQTAERAYKAQPGEIGVVDTTLKAAQGARLNWLPQETILFDGSALNRRLTVDLAENASFLAAETVIFGRAAMGERLSAMHFTDNWRIRRDGELIFAEAMRLNDIAALARPAAMAGAGACATILLASDKADALLGDVRRLLPKRAGASSFDGKLVVRMLADDGFEMRRALIPLITLLNGGPPPKVWMI